MRKSGVSAARRPGSLGLAASVLFHLVILTALGLALRQASFSFFPNAIQVGLVRAPAAVSIAPSRPRPRQTPVRSAATPRTPIVAHVAPSAPPIPAPMPPIALPPSAPPQTTAQDDVRRALRATLGCAHPDAVGLTPEEREACRRNELKSGPAYAAEPTDPAKAAAFRRADRNARAWRDYRASASVDDYPGGRCAFGRDCEPAAPQPPPDPINDTCPYLRCNMGSVR